MNHAAVSSGIPALDEVIHGLRPGDNVVWQVDSLEDYIYFAEPFAHEAIQHGHRCVYIRFADHPPVIKNIDGLEVIELDPAPGFDSFSSEVHEIIEERGVGVCYILDNLSALVAEWATDELLANFFQVTCPFLFELKTFTYFALTRGKHAHSAVARIRDTTQVLIDAYHVDGAMYIHPLKVWDRYSPQMYLPHEVSGEHWSALSRSGEAAAVSVHGRKGILDQTGGSIAPWESVYKKLQQHYETGAGWPKQSPELNALRQEFGHMLMGNHPEFDELVNKYLTLDDLFGVRNRLIGSGRIGGKAAGMLLARRILQSNGVWDGVDFSRVLEDHDSFYIGSDVFFTFLVNNDLFRLRLRLTRSSRISHEEFQEVEERFLDGKFPKETIQQFRSMLDYFGQAPIIVRSSSLLEDSFGNAFAGKYLSEFCANQGNPEERMEAFLAAVKRVYASAVNPNALSYRRDRGLGENDEQMAILVQRVSGMPYEKYFFPSIAGVAFSKNLYAWSDRIDRQKGVIRLVFGLGTRAVDRVGSDYPRMIAVSSPKLRPESGLQIVKYSQRQVDLLDLDANRFNTINIAEALNNMKYPNMHLFVSTKVQDYVEDPVTNIVEGESDNLILTFNNLIKRTDLVKIIGAMLEKLEEAYGRPVDIEFTAHIYSNDYVRVNLLQCRPLFLPGMVGSVSVPIGIPREKVLFRSSRMVNGGVITNIRYIIFIDPQRYSALPMDMKKSLGRLVGRINEHPNVIEHKAIMMGPGRWGSSNIELGVNVGYADIDNTAVLVEMAREEAGHLPEVSYGTHFFQDLVEAQIIYLPVYPDDPKAEFNAQFFELSENILTDIIPDAGEFERIVYVIDVPAQTGEYLNIIADPQSQEAVCFLQ